MSIPVRWNMPDTLCDAYHVRSDKSSSLHGHHHFLLTLIIDGRGIQQINGVDHPFSTGDLFILSPADFHMNIVNEGERFEYYGVKFSYDILDGELSELCDIRRFPAHINLTEATGERMRFILETLLDECGAARQQPGSATMLRTLVQQLVILAVREMPAVAQAPSGVFVNRVLGYLQSNFHYPITVSDASSYMGYTPNYFSMLFKERIGVNFGEYLKGMRLSYARNLLLSGKMSVTEVAMEAGFGSLAHFSRSFLQAYGYSPKQFAKRGGDGRDCRE